MTDPAPSFAIIPVPDGKPPVNAIAHGSMFAVMERLLDSKSRTAALDLVARAEQAVEQEREREQRDQAIVTNGIGALADAITRLSRRLDGIERSQVARHQLDAASEATARMLALPKDAPDPDAPADYVPSPSGELHGVEPKDPAEHQRAEFDDMGGVPLSYRAVPSSYVRSGDQGELPAELERRTPPSGTEPILPVAPLPPFQQPIGLEE
jgi:hypothetical protein